MSSDDVQAALFEQYSNTAHLQLLREPTYLTWVCFRYRRAASYCATWLSAPPESITSRSARKAATARHFVLFAFRLPEDLVALLCREKRCRRDLYWHLGLLIRNEEDIAPFFVLLNSGTPPTPCNHGAFITSAYEPDTLPRV